MNAMAYITVWDSYTNGVSQHYLPVTIPSATIPGNPTPVIFKASMGKAIHEAICADTGEPLDDWEVVDTREVVEGVCVIALISRTKLDVSTYSVRFAP